MLYAKLAALYDVLESTPKRLEMTFHIARFLSDAPSDDLGALVLLIQGRVFPVWDESKIGVAEKIVIKAIAKSTGASTKDIEKRWTKVGDLGKVFEEMGRKGAQMTLANRQLDIQGVLGDMRRLATMEGKGSVDRKIDILQSLLTAASPKEGKYLVRTALEQMRLGVGAGTLRDAITWAFLPTVGGMISVCDCGGFLPDLKTCPVCGNERPKKHLDILERSKENGMKHGFPVLDTKTVRNALSGRAIQLPSDGIVIEEDEGEARDLYNELIALVQRGFDLTSDFGVVASEAKLRGVPGLLSISMHVGTPIKAMLAIKEDTIHGALEAVGKPAAAEYKLDGFRMQVHKDGEEIKIFTRRLENVTEQFPEIVKAARTLKSEQAIFDGEAVGFDAKTGKYLPFQTVSQRIRRKYGIDEMAGNLPVQLNLFDVLFLDGDIMIDKPFEQRRKALEKLLPKGDDFVRLVPQLISRNESEFEAFFGEAMEKGHEGIMFKNLTAPYQPGSRVGHMIKYKTVMDPLDLVIVKAESGEGKRAGWLTSYTLACKDGDDLLEVGKVSTGLKEKREEGLSFDEMTQRLHPLVKGEGKIVDVEPRVIVEVHYEEIQASSNYGSGFALRFPRIIRLRDDKDVDEIADVQEIELLYDKQRFRGK